MSGISQKDESGDVTSNPLQQTQDLCLFCKEKLNPGASACKICQRKQHPFLGGFMPEFGLGVSLLGLVVSVFMAVLSTIQAGRARDETILAEQAVRSANDAQIRAEEIGEQVEDAKKYLPVALALYDSRNPGKHLGTHVADIARWKKNPREVVVTLDEVARKQTAAAKGMLVFANSNVGSLTANVLNPNEGTFHLVLPKDATVDFDWSKGIFVNLTVFTP